MIEALVLLGTACLGVLLVSATIPVSRQWKSPIPISWPLGLALGIGLTSCVYFLAVVCGLSRTKLLLLEIACLGALLAWRRSRGPRRAAKPESRSDSWLAWTAGGLVLALIAAGVVCVALVLQNPHGSWDAVAIWNDRAHFLYRARTEGLNPLSTQSVWAHPDYPLLLPGSTARLWEWAGRESVTAPVALSLAALTATVGLLGAALQHFRSTRQAVLAVCIAISTPFLAVSATHQMADVFVALYMLASLVLYALSQTSSIENRRLLALAGMMAGFCAWTKNEGILFALAFLVSLFFLGRRAEWAGFGAGCAPVLATVVLLKSLIDVPNDIVGSLEMQTAKMVLDPARYYGIGRRAMVTLFDLDGWPNLVLVAMAYAAIAGLNVPKDWRRMVRITGITIGLVAAGYCAVYLITPNSLSWQLRRSAARLFLQLWPSILFLVFLVSRSGVAREQETVGIAERPA